MSSILSDLVGKKVSKAEVLHDYLQVWFDDGWVLNIFNKYLVISFDGDIACYLRGREVGAISECKDKVEIIFTGGGVLHIGLCDCDYQGPESIELIDNTGKRIVWQ